MSKTTSFAALRRSVLLALTSGMLLAGSCSQYFDEFRSASADSFRSGFDALADGFVAGAFAVFEPDPDADNTGRAVP